MNKSDADILFDFLSDILFEEKSQKLELSRLSEQARDLGEGMNFLSESVEQLRDYATGLARGELEMKSPPKENHLVWPLKGLQSNLQHLTWQTQQVAKGDYNQRVDFLGNFSTAFNQMVQQLEQREISLRSEMEKVSKKVSALERSRRLFQSLAENLPMSIIILGRDSGKLLFWNEMGRRLTQQEPEIATELLKTLSSYLFEGDESRWEHESTATSIENAPRRYQINSFCIEWVELDAVVHIIYDVTAQHAHDKMLHNFAYKDPSTGLYNRRYCMDKLQEYAHNREQFSLCFIDLDQLKVVNDKFGHNEGDFYINSLARLLITSLRQRDTICRIGGDEFVVLMPRCPEITAVDRIQILRKNFTTTPYGKPYAFSFSYGVVSIAQDEHFDCKKLLEQADQKMYLHKKQQQKSRIPQSD